MATEKPTPPPGATKMEAESEGDEQEIELGPGDVLQGLLLSVRSGESQYGPWHLLRFKDTVSDRGVVRYFAEGEVKALATKGDLEEGQEYWICKDVTEKEYDGNDYFPVEVREVN